MSRRSAPRVVQPTVGLIVEGETEFKALPLLHKKNLVPGCPPLHPTNLNGIGSHMNIQAIAKMVTPKVKAHIAAGRTRVILCIDREQRAECTGEFATALHSAIVARAGSVDVHVVIADRTFEAWILADARGLYESRKFKVAPNFVCFEGRMGERDRKGCIELDRLLGREYSKTVDGPRLFEAMDFDRARTFGPGQHGSRSLDKLLRTLGVVRNK